VTVKIKLINSKPLFHDFTQDSMTNFRFKLQKFTDIQLSLNTVISYVLFQKWWWPKYMHFC